MLQPVSISDLFGSLGFGRLSPLSQGEPCCQDYGYTSLITTTDTHILGPVEKLQLL